MKVVTIVGTRPEMIRLSLIIKKLDQFADRHILIHTGQNFTPDLSDVFFKQLQLRAPDYVIMNRHYSLGEQLAVMFAEAEKILLREKPDRMLLLGDTNSALLAILAERMGIPVIHMEAGNRCFDLNVPEEMNRKVIDAVSSVNMPYTRQSKANLIKEGVPSHRIIVTGNPIYEVLQHYANEIASSTALSLLSLTAKKYFLVTIHRAENVDHPANLNEILQGLNQVASYFGKPVICSMHPRTRSKLTDRQIKLKHPLVRFHEPFGFFDFVKLEQEAYCVLTDSGTVQEECCIFGVPTVTVRTSTERPETVDCGSNVVSGIGAAQIIAATKVMTQMATEWECPEGYLDVDVSDKVVKFVLGGSIYAS